MHAHDLPGRPHGRGAGAASAGGAATVRLRAVLALCSHGRASSQHVTSYGRMACSAGQWTDLARTATACARSSRAYGKRALHRAACKWPEVSGKWYCRCWRTCAGTPTRSRTRCTSRPRQPRPSRARWRPRGLQQGMWTFTRRAPVPGAACLRCRRSPLSMGPAGLGREKGARCDMRPPRISCEAGECSRLQLVHELCRCFFCSTQPLSVTSQDAV